MLLYSKGHVGVITVTKKVKGLGYNTSYREPASLYKAHKVVGVRATLTKNLPVSTLVGRYGQPDDVVKQSGAKVDFRYWVITLRNNRPESSYAVDFEVNNGICSSFTISTSGVDFVQQRLDSLLRTWEWDYVLD